MIWTELYLVKKQLEEEREINAEAMRIAGEWHKRQIKGLIEENKLLKERIKRLEQPTTQIEIPPKSGN